MEDYKYIAFISHNSDDEKEAKWLQEKLTDYRLPTKLCSDLNLKERRLPTVFRYQTNLGGAEVLKTALHKELSESKFLIVICSPNSAKSGGVGTEIQYFIDQGLTNNIIPFIISGTPYSNDENECFHPLLKELYPKDSNMLQSNEILGININEKGIDNRFVKRDKAVARVVSRLLGIDFGSLWNWQKVRLIRQRIVRGCLIACLLAALCVVYEYLDTDYTYYKDYADCNGMPTGILEISGSQAERAYACYRFETSRGRLQRVVYVNRFGTPIEYDNTETRDRCTIQDLEYTNGVLTSILYSNSLGDKLYRLVFSKDYLSADIKNEENSQAANVFGSITSIDNNTAIDESPDFIDRIINNSPAKVGRYIYERDDDGYITKSVFCKFNGNDDEIGYDRDGISGIEYERDALHRPVKVSFLNSRMKRAMNKYGVSCKKYIYDEKGYIAEAHYLGIFGEPVVNEQGWSTCRDSCDIDGYPLKSEFFDINGKPSYHKYGESKITVEYLTEDKREFIYHMYNTEGEPTVTAGSTSIPGGYFAQKVTLNKEGRIAEIVCLGADNKPALNTMRYAYLRYEYDKNGRIVKQSFFNKDNKACSTIYGSAAMEYTYNEKGQPLEICNYDKYGHKVNTFDSGYKSRYEYDKRGRLLKIQCYGSGLQTYSTRALHGACAIKYEYRGSSPSISAVSFLDGNDKEMNLPDINVARVEIEREESGLPTEIKFFDFLGLPCNNSAGCHKVTRKYDSNGRLILSACYDTDNHLTDTSSGGAVEIMTYDSNGRLINRKLLDSDSLPINKPGFAAELRFVYKGIFKTEESCFDGYGNPAEINGYHKFKYDYDVKGRVVATYSYSIGQAKRNIYEKVCRMKYNAANNPTEWIYEDANGMPLNDKALPYKLVREYNNLGLITCSKTFDINGHLTCSQQLGGVAVIKLEYDDEGNYIAAYNYDQNNKLKTSNVGFAYGKSKECPEYLYCKYFDENNKPGYNMQENYMSSSIIIKNELGLNTFEFVTKYNTLTNGLDSLYAIYEYDNNSTATKVIAIDGQFCNIYFKTYSTPQTFQSGESRYKHLKDSIINIGENLKMKYNIK